MHELFNVPLEVFLSDPYSHYKRLRSESPIYWDERSQSWILTRYADVAAIPKDSRFLAFPTFSAQDPRYSAIKDLMAGMMLYKNPPEHTRLRTLVNKAFVPRSIDKIRSYIEEIVTALLDRLKPAGHMDLINDFAHPLPVSVITRMLGVPVEDDPLFRQWTQDVIPASESPDLLTQPVLERANRGALAFDEYFRALIKAKRQQPADDLMSALIMAEDEGQSLSTEELIAMSVLLLVAGHETTVSLIGNGILSLLNHRDQFTVLKDSPNMIESAVEEFLRFDSPAQLVIRMASEDIDWAGQKFLKGNIVQLVLGAANRDPAFFPNPDQLDVSRKNNKHMAFGGGIHYCLGAYLSRVEAQIAIGMLIARMPNLKLATDKLEWRHVIGIRGLKTLSVTF